MKKRFVMPVVLVLCSVLAVPAHASVNIFNGSTQVYEQADPSPKNVNGRILLPVDEMVKLIDGAAYSIDGEVIVITSNDVTVEMQIGKQEATINAEESAVIDGAPPTLYGDTVYVPLRFVAEAFDKRVMWDGQFSSVSLMDSETVSAIEDLFSLKNYQYDKNAKVELNFVEMSRIVGYADHIPFEGLSSSENILDSQLEVIYNLKHDGNVPFLYGSMSYAFAEGGEVVTVETYDDGEFTYNKTNNDTHWSKDVSAMTDEDYDDILATLNEHYNPYERLTEQTDFFSFNLTENEGITVVTGIAAMTEEILAIILGELYSTYGIPFLGDMAIMPTGYVFVNNSYTDGVPDSFYTEYEAVLTFDTPVDDGIIRYSFICSYINDIFDLTVNADFDSVIAQEIIDEAEQYMFQYEDAVEVD